MIQGFLALLPDSIVSAGACFACYSWGPLQCMNGMYVSSVYSLIHVMQHGIAQLASGLCNQRSMRSIGLASLPVVVSRCESAAPRGTASSDVDCAIQGKLC